MAAQILGFPVQTGNCAPKVTSLDDYRQEDSESVLLVALEMVRKQRVDGLVLAIRPKGARHVAWTTGEYHRDPEKAMGLLSRVWAQLASRATV